MALVGMRLNDNTLLSSLFLELLNKPHLLVEIGVSEKFTSPKLIFFFKRELEPWVVDEVFSGWSMLW